MSTNYSYFLETLQNIPLPYARIDSKTTNLAQLYRCTVTSYNTLMDDSSKKVTIPSFLPLQFVLFYDISDKSVIMGQILGGKQKDGGDWYYQVSDLSDASDTLFNLRDYEIIAFVKDDKWQTPRSHPNIEDVIE